MKSKIPFHKRIVFRIPLIIILVLVTGLGVMSFYFSKAQIDTLYFAHEQAVSDEAEILFRSIKANMLAGEAKIAVDLMKELRKGNASSEIHIFDAAGNPAFTTNDTLYEVNTYLNEERFAPKDMFELGQRPNNAPLFFDAVTNVRDVFGYVKTENAQSVEIYKPLVNQPKCNECHGVDTLVRGVIYISHPMEDVEKRSARMMHISVALFVLMVTFLTTVIIIFLRRTVLHRIVRIGSTVEQIGQGNFIKMVPRRNDEIGRLAEEINKMVDGLKERFRLSKFVSRSTLEYIKTDEDIRLGGGRECVVVMFTDIRGFTSYAESRSPEEVLGALNRVMNLQVEIINQYDGDIDKFVGDEIMAIFTGENMAVRAVRAALEIRRKVRNFDRGDGQAFAVGVGINAGEVILGNMGGHERIDRTIIGDTVNLGARLCSVAGKNTIVISANVYERVKERTVCEAQEPFFVKGKKDPITAYIVKGLENEQKTL